LEQGKLDNEDKMFCELDGVIYMWGYKDIQFENSHLCLDFRSNSILFTGLKIRSWRKNFRIVISKSPILESQMIIIMTNRHKACIIK
jgi:hypothetical protein